MDHEDQKQFNKELASSYNTIPCNSEPLAGQDVNSNIGVRSKMFRNVIGTNGIDNRNAKSKDLLFLLSIIKFRVLLTYTLHGVPLTLLDLHIYYTALSDLDHFSVKLNTAK